MINSSSSTDRPSKTAVLYTKVRRGPTLGLVTLGLGRPRLFFSDRPVLARGKTCILLVCVCNKKIWLVNRARHLESADRKLKIDGRAATQCTDYNNCVLSKIKTSNWRTGFFESEFTTVGRKSLVFSRTKVEKNRI